MSSAHARDTLAEVREQIDALYPDRLALLLVPLCSPTPHDHQGGACKALGKRPIPLGWNAEAVARWQSGVGRDSHLDEIARHVATGGNAGWTVPPGVLVLDADTTEAVAWLDAALPDAPLQESRPGRAHFVVKVPADLAINATVKAEVVVGIAIDLRSAGRSQIAVAPSCHASGSLYTWKRSLPHDLAELPECPAALLARIVEPAPRARASGNGRKIAEGGRNAYLHRIGCAMRGRGMTEREIREELHAENARYCDPPLDADEVDAIVASVLRHVAGEAQSGDPRRFFGDGGLVVPRLADEVRSLALVAVGIDGRLYRYAEGVYRGDGDAFVRAEVRKLLGDLFKRRHLDEVGAYLRADFASVTDRQPDGLLNLRDGLLEWSASNGPTLHDHAAEIVSTVQIPHRWRPEARCPRIDAFLEAVVPDAGDFVLEVIGYALLPANPLRVAILFLGPGRNGKSVILAIIKALLGAENVSAVPLQALAEHRFAAAEMFGKLANICGDLDARAVKQTDTFKMLTGGDSIMGERKHRDPFTFTPFALPIFSANEAPLSSDQTEAWFDRWIIVPMPRRIPESEIDPHLTAKLTTRDELEGLLVRAVDALRRLMARGRFELPESVREARAAYRERLDTVAGFVGECCELAPEAWTERPALYRAYRTWATEGGRLPVSAATFNDHLRAGFAERVAERKRHGRWGWAGILHGAAL